MALSREGVERENMLSLFPSFNLLLLLSIVQTLPEAKVPASQSTEPGMGWREWEGDGKWNIVSTEVWPELGRQSESLEASYEESQD